MEYYLGIDLGGTNIAAGCVNENGTILGRHTVPTAPDRGAQAVIADIAAALFEAARQTAVAISDISCIGIGVPGTVDRVSGNVIFAPNIAWRDVKLRDELQKIVNLPVLAANDADCAALAETFFGCAKGHDSAVLITIGTGIGGGFIYNRQIFYGGLGFGIEPGHMTLRFGGEKCGCGKTGCFETEASCSALLRRARGAMAQNRDSLLWEECGYDADRLDGRAVFRAARQGDALAVTVLDAYTDALTSGIGSVVCMFWPEVVILGGGISAEEDLLVRPVREKLPNYLYAGDTLSPPPILRASLGNDAGIIGAALLGKQADSASYI